MKVSGLAVLLLLAGPWICPVSAAPAVTIDSVLGDIHVSVQPGMSRQCNAVVADVTVSAGAGYDIEVLIEPGLGWNDVDMNTNHPAIAGIGDYALGFDVAITTGSESPGDPGPAVWQLGGAQRLNESQAITDWHVHTRLVLVDEMGETAAFSPGEDNVRFQNLPAGVGRQVDIVVIVTEEQ